MSVRIEMIVQLSDGKVFNISELASNIKWSTDLINAQPGSLEFDYDEDVNAIPDYGNIIRFRVNSRNIFFGRLFIKERNEKGVMHITAYDNMRYLQNKHTYVLPAMTSEQIFRRICRDFELPQRVVNGSSFNVSQKIHENTSLFDVLQDAFDQTLIARRQWFFVRDNFGRLEHVNIDSLQTDLVIGDESMAHGFDFKGSIDEDTYNQIRLVRENQVTSRREVYIVRHGGNIRRWGLLQHHETVDENLNKAQIEAQASLLLNAKNRPTRSLTITAFGDLQIRAGSGIVLSINRLKDEGFSRVQRALVCGCVHSWRGSTHTMDLVIRVVN